MPMNRLPSVNRILLAVMEVAPQGVIVADPEGVILWANPRADALFGYGSGELTGQPVANVLPKQFRARHNDHLRHYFDAPQARPMGLGLELTGLRKDGTAFPAEIGLGYIAPPTGPLAIAFVTDITERKVLETERDQFFELSPDPLCIVRGDGSLSQVNPAFAAQLGFGREEMSVRTFATFIHPEDRERAQTLLGRLLAGQQAIQFENRLIAKDGSVRWFQWTAQAPASGEPVRYAVARDVTGAREAAEAQQRLVALIENITDFVGLASADEPFRILHINKGGRDMLGLPPLTELQHLTIHDLAIVDAGMQEQIEEGLARTGDWTGELKMRHYATGEWIPVELNLFLVLFTNGDRKPIARGLVARDIRERKYTEERLRALARQLLTAQEEERRRIARDLHDDLSQKLAGTAIELGLLRQEKLPSAARARLVRLEEHVGELAEDLRNIAHDLHPAILEHVGLSAALEAHCAEVSRQRAISIRCSAVAVPGGIPPETAVVLYRIAQEAVGNSVKHSGASLVEVVLTGMQGAEGRIKLIVADNGKGFSLDNIRDSAGLGLLSIEERVQLVNGKLEIHSRPNEGSRLEVEVPLA
jgi:PAS domain S-box-containing protein